MSIYNVLNEIVSEEKRKVHPNLFTDDAREKLCEEIDIKLFDILKNISSLGQKITKKGIEFVPFMIWEGKRSFALEDMTEENYSLLESVDLQKLPLNMRARVGDVLWTQRKVYKAAEIAAEAYLDLFNRWFDDDEWVDTLDLIKRAIFISAQISKDLLYAASCQTVYNHIIRLNGSDEHFLSISLIEIVVGEAFGDIDNIIQVLDNIIKSNSNCNKIERAYKLKIKCYGLKKNREAVKAVHLELASYYISTAERLLNNNIQGVLQAETFYQKAINIYRNNGEAKKGEEIHRRLIAVQKKIPELMVPFSTSIDVSNICENIDKNMDGLSFKESVIRLTQMVTFYKRSQVKDKVFADIRDYPLSHLFGKNVINCSGQTIFSLPPLNMENPEKDQTLLDMHIFQKMLELEDTAGNFYLKYALSLIRQKYKFELSDLDFLFKDNPIIPVGRERIFQSAMYMILKGQYYEGLHILAPQVENIFRTIAKEAGGLTVTLESDGTSKEKVLSSIFELPELLDCYDNDILFIFRGLLNEQAGANIRNNIAHGILEERSSSMGSCLYFYCAVIKLLSYTSVKCYDLIMNSERLQSFVPLKKYESECEKENKETMEDENEQRAESV